MVAAAPLGQMTMFEASPVGEIDIKRKPHRRKLHKKPTRAMAVEQVDYGRGMCELTTTLRSKIEYKTLDDRKKIGTIAHIAKERMTRKWCRENRASYLASGLNFGDWFLKNKTSHDLAMKQWAKTFGFVTGWWNESPVGTKPRMSDKQIVKLFESLIRNKDV